VLEMSIAKNQ